MRKHILFFAAAALLVGACNSESTETVEEEVEVINYTLDTENSVLKWHGEENEQHFHDGTLSFKSGSLKTENGTPVEGEFVIDANSVNAQTEGYPEEKMGYLSGHLKDTAFLFVAEYPTIDVKTAEYKDGKLHTIITVLGVPVTHDIPVVVTSTEEGLSIKGDFAIDFAETGMKYITEVDPETGKAGAKSEFKFGLDLHLKK